jgi:hypothetical protein
MKCQQWRQESWDVQGLPQIVPEGMSVSQEREIGMWTDKTIKQSEYAVRSFQGRSQQFLYERGKKQKNVQASYDMNVDVNKTIVPMDVDYTPYVNGIQGDDIRRLSESIHRRELERKEKKERRGKNRMRVVEENSTTEIEK